MIFNRINNYYKIKIKHMNVSDINIERLSNMGAQIGKECHIYSANFALEPQLVTVGDNCTISSGVLCVTHDNAIIHHLKGKTDLFGKVSIGNNCFVGTRTLIMYGVSIGDDCIIGAGSVVTKSVPSGMVAAGNPAKVICSVEQYVNKYKKFAVDWDSVEEKNSFFNEHPEILIQK
jgi:acetyltransferase-like isoleucine patch superfamily enzyme